jgi:transketolase
VKHGAYILEDGGKDVVLIGTGSEVELVLKAAEVLKSEGIGATVVSMPSFKIFEEQRDAYKASIFPEATPKIAVEAGSTMGWWKYVGHNGGIIGVDKFGASAPGPTVMEKYGVTTEAIVALAKKLLKK